MRKIILLLAVFMANNFYGQLVFRNTSGQPLTFKEMQLQFSRFKKENDLSKKRGWKAYKRFEYEMLMHTNTEGEPGNCEDYLNEAIKSANAKKARSSMSSPWAPVGPYALPNNLTGYMENGMGRVNCVAFHPSQANTFYVGVAQGGLWKTTNGGTSYSCLTDNLPITRISDVCVDPSSPNTLYISLCDFEYIGWGLWLNGRKRMTHYGLGVYKSTDGGSTWNPTGLSFQLTNGDASLIRKIVVNPVSSNLVLACGVSGMYKSTNGGTSWVKVVDSLFWDMVQDPISPNVVYAATGWVSTLNKGSAAIYKSSDFGSTWSLLNTGIPYQGSVQRIRLGVSPGDNNYVYAVCVDNQSGLYGVYKSTNAGVNWSYISPSLNILEWGQGSSPGGQGTYDLGMCMHPTDKNIFYVGGINIWMTTDGGNNFNPCSDWTLNEGPTLHGDIHYLAYNPVSSNYYACSDGGVYRTGNIIAGDWIMNWPTVWTKLNDGMQITSFYRLSSSRNAAGRLVAGAQDNGSFYYNGSSWFTVFGGDGMDNYLDPMNPQDIIGSSQYGSFYYSNDGGNSSINVGSNPNGEQAEWTTPIVADYNTAGVLYVGNENVAKSTDGGQNWTPLASIYTNTSTLQNTEISALAVSNTNGNVIYAARRVRYELGMPGFVFRTTNGGAAFTNITGNLPDSLYYTSMDVSPTSSNEVIISMAGFSPGKKIYKSVTGGGTWTNISYNLPNLPVNCVKYMPLSGQILAATDIGLYVLNVGSTSWTSYSQGLPNVILTDIEFNQALNKIYLSTFGRGIWSTDMMMITGLQQQPQVQPTDFAIYPSVNKGNFIIEKKLEKENTKVDVIDVQGKNVYSSVLHENRTEINLKVNSGIYYVRVTSGDIPGVKKIVVE